MMSWARWGFRRSGFLLFFSRDRGAEGVNDQMMARSPMAGCDRFTAGILVEERGATQSGGRLGGPIWNSSRSCLLSISVMSFFFSLWPGFRKNPCGAGPRCCHHKGVFAPQADEFFRRRENAADGVLLDLEGGRLLLFRASCRRGQKHGAGTAARPIVSRLGAHGRRSMCEGRDGP